MSRTSKSKSHGKLSRREFARGVTVAAITGVVPLAQAAENAGMQQSAAQPAQLSPEFEA